MQKKDVVGERGEQHATCWTGVNVSEFDMDRY